MSLFKYAGCGRVDVLATRQIQFSPLSMLNDPFEALPNTDVINPSIVNEFLPGMLVREAIQSVAERRATRPIGVYRGEAQRVYAERAQFHKRRIVSQIPSILGRFRILSLSRARPDSVESLLLWGHYTNSHQGMVFEFDEQHPWMKSGGTDLLVDTRAGNVSYEKHRPAFMRGKHDADYFFNKSDAWSYEQEYRVVRPVPQDHNGRTNGDLLVSWPSEMLLSVTLGVRASADTEIAVKDVLNSCRSFSRVRLQRVQPHVDEYRFEIVRLKKR